MPRAAELLVSASAPTSVDPLRRGLPLTVNALRIVLGNMAFTTGELTDTF